MRERLGRALLLWALWMGVALAFSLQTFITEEAFRPGRIEWWVPFAINFGCYQLWFLLTPLVLYLGRRFPVEAAPIRRNAAVHAVSGLLVPTVYLLLCQVFVFHWLRPEAYRPKTLGGEFLMSVVANLHLEVLTYGAVIAIQAAIRVHAERQATALKTARMEASLAEARLLALQMQLQPHFLFNALHTVSELVHESPAAAERALALLGDLLRRHLHDTRPEVPLGEEMELLDGYLALQEIRFSDRLTVERRVPDELRGALVPSLVLQPLVENALRHGLARRPGPGRLEIEAGRTDERKLRLSVRNDGPPLAAPIVEGVGLSNTRTRLRQLYGEAHTLALTNDPRGGVRADLVVPMRMVGEPAS